MRNIDFEGDYGRQYREKVHTWLPGYDLLHETAVIAVQALKPDAKTILSVGPGPGDETASFLEVCPKATATLVEPSEQMQVTLHRTLARYHDSREITYLRLSLDQAASSVLEGLTFDVVACHSLLHLIEGPAKDRALQQLACLTAKGGLLVISGSSLTEDPFASKQLRVIAGQRLLNRGMDPEPVSRCVERPDDVSCILNSWLDPRLIAAGFSRPLKIAQILHHNLWVAQKHEH